MLNDTLNKIDEILKSSSQLTEAQKTELKRLNEQLRKELQELAKTKQEQAASIAGFASVATYEALREQQHPELAQMSMEGLKTSIDEFEQSHPRLFTTIQALISSLRGLGI
jgi:hypothetical protein